MDMDSTVTLNNGVEMPHLGLGTYRLDSPRQTRQVVLWALEEGYRLVDTAKYYGNERDIGAALAESGVPREELFVTTKLWNDDHGYDSTIRACRRSTEDLGLDYLDLYLIHWPVPGQRDESWRAMEWLLDEGLCRAVGVSNYMVNHLEELLAGSRTVPAVNQVEFHPCLYQGELLGFCRANGIQLQAYSPLARTRGFGDPVVREVSARYGKTPAQIYLRWSLQHEVAVIPKSSNRERLKENTDVFDFSISPGDMRLLDSLSRDLHVSWDPSGAP
jgi:methylglyoxal/glyoxal reductase